MIELKEGNAIIATMDSELNADSIKAMCEAKLTYDTDLENSPASCVYVDGKDHARIALDECMIPLGDVTECLTYWTLDRKESYVYVNHTLYARLPNGAYPYGYAGAKID